MNEFQFTFEPIVDSVEWLIKKLGAPWAERNLVRYQKKPTDKEIANFSYLYKRGIHPLIPWYAEYLNYKNNYPMNASTSVKRLTLLAQSLKLVSHDDKFDKLLARLKNENEFFGAMFEVEVAASHILGGWNVKLIEETNRRTPDLYLTRTGETPFWIECKYRDGGSPEDQKITRAWQHVEKQLLRILTSENRNYQVILRAIGVVDETDVASKLPFISDTIHNKFELSNYKRLRGSHLTAVDPTGKFELTIYKLSETDEVLDNKTFRLPASQEFFTNGIFQCEQTDLDNGDVIMINPVAIQFFYESPIDHIAAIRSSFRSAVKQLPQSGPSVIHISIPINSWVHNIDEARQKITHVIENELSGAQNKRVNAVIVQVRYTELLNDGVFRIPFLDAFSIVIEHKEPRNFVKPES